MTTYFDNAATTFPKPEEVYVFMDKFYREYGVNVGRGQHKLATKAQVLVNETREMLLDLNHSPNKQVVFTHTATEALNMILHGINLHNGNNVYVSPFEHNAVMRVLFYLKKYKNFNIITLKFDKEKFIYDIEKIKHQFINNPPSVVIISHASNVFGVIAPIIEITTLSKRYKAINVIDMCQTMGLIDMDISSSSIDYAVFAGHKTLYASFGVAGFICSTDVKLEPFMFGGTGIDSANRDLPDTIPEKYEVGSPNIMAIAGLNAALKWSQFLGIDNIFKMEQNNHIKLLEILNDFDNIKIIPQPYNICDTVGVVSCIFNGYSSDSIGKVLSENDIAVRTGLHCAPDAHRFMGTFPGGTVRFSVSYFNKDVDFEILEKILTYIKNNS